MNSDVEAPVEGASEEKQKLDLEVKVETVSACVRHVMVEISRADIDRYFAEKFDEIAPDAFVPGFRVGRAPRKLLENRYRKQVADQVKGSLLMDSLTQVSEEQEFSAISEPDFDFEAIKLPDEGPMKYEFNIEVRPEFEVPRWKGLELKTTSTEVSDEELDRDMEELFESLADLEPVDEPVSPGDYIVANLVSRFQGDTINKRSEMLLRAKSELSLSDGIVNDFGSLMEGARAGDRRTAQAVISDYSSNEKLRGQQVDIEIEVLDVKRLDLSDRDQMAQKLGATDEAELRNRVADRTASRLAYKQRQQIRQQISESLTESADWELPQDLLKRQAARELDRAVIEMRSSGFNDEQILSQENYLRQNAMERTEALLKEHFILERIAEEEEIEETDEDFEVEIAKMALQRHDSPRRIRAQLERNNQMDALRNMIIEQKVINLITEHAEIKESEPKAKENKDSYAVKFFAAGQPDANIPKAKYANETEGSIPGVTPERD